MQAASRHPGSRRGALRLGRPRHLGAPLRGAEGLYIVGPYAQPDADVLVRDLLTAAVDARRIVLLSVIGADRLPSVVPMAGWERDVQQSGKEWTILRPNWFQQNFAEGFLSSLRDKGTLELPAADARVSFVDTRDIAAAAAVALTSDGHSGQVYELTGPEALTHTEALEILGQAVGRELHYSALDPVAHAEHLRGRSGRAFGHLAERPLLLMHDGGDSHVTDTVQRLTGRPARSLASFAEENAAAWHG